MTKQEMQKHYARLDYIYDRFLEGYRNRNGKNIKIRKEASRQMDIATMMFDNYVKLEGGWELYEWVSNGQGSDDYFAMKVAYDEFCNPTWFQHDMPRFLEELKKTIAKTPDDEPEEDKTKEAPE